MKVIISDNIFYDNKSGQNQNVQIGTEFVIKKPANPTGKYTKSEMMDYEIMQKYPQLFAKIISLENTSVKQEVLDAEKFEKDLYDCVESFKEIGFEFGSENNKYYQALEIIFSIKNKEPDIKKFAVQLPKQQFYFFKQLYELITKIINIYESADLHPNQFGYDKNNKIKCFDI